MPKMTKKQAGSIGGKTTFQKYGREHMQKLGKAGAESTWNRYALYPAGTRGFIMWDKQTGKIKRYIDYIPDSK